MTALTVKAAIDDPHRFFKSKTVGAHFGLTSRRIQSGDAIDIEGHISKCGDSEVRTVLYEAGSAMLVRSKEWCSVKAWGLRIAAKRGHKRAVVAVARKLAVIMHRMWLDGSEFRFAAAEQKDSGVEGKKDGARRRLLRLWRAPSCLRFDGRQLVELPPRGGETFGGSKRMRRARNLAGADCTTAYPARSHHRVVTLATRSPG